MACLGFCISPKKMAVLKEKTKASSQFFLIEDHAIRAGKHFLTIMYPHMQQKKRVISCDSCNCGCFTWVSAREYFLSVLASLK